MTTQEQDEIDSQEYRLCKECGSADIGEHRAGDEGYIICGSCRSVEQGYKYVTAAEYEDAP